MRGSNIIPKNIPFRKAALILIGLFGFTTSVIGDEVFREYCAEVAEKETGFQNFRRSEFFKPYFEDVTEDGADVLQDHLGELSPLIRATWRVPNP